MTPLKRLVLAIFKQAVKDFKDRHRDVSASSSWSVKKSVRDRQDSIDFLCADVGEWRESRETWARMIGMRVQRLHEWAKGERRKDATD